MVNRVEPNVRLLVSPMVDYDEMGEYVGEVGGDGWMDGVTDNDGQDLVEFAGRLCYRSWEPGLNKNVTRVRKNQEAYLANVLGAGHGSVAEHLNMTFLLTGVSRVFTHELVRHRAGSAFSQESLRFVRLEELDFWFPEWALKDRELTERSLGLLTQMEEHQAWMAQRFGLDKEGVDFAEKKAKTSFMRRFAPEGLATAILWTVNARALRHVLEVRTAEGAEEEMRLVFNRVGELVGEEWPALFRDFEIINGAWVPKYRKV